MNHSMMLSIKQGFRTQLLRGRCDLIFKNTALFCSKTSKSADEGPEENSETEWNELKPSLPKLPKELQPEMVEMWNKNAPVGPEWGGPRGQEPTKFGDWAKNGRVSDF